MFVGIKVLNDLKVSKLSSVKVLESINKQNIQMAAWNKQISEIKQDNQKQVEGITQRLKEISKSVKANDAQLAETVLAYNLMKKQVKDLDGTYQGLLDKMINLNSSINALKTQSQPAAIPQAVQ